MAGAPPPTALSVHGIRMEFPAVVALNGVSIDFLPGEVHGVIGENGAGKSTLMKILSGVQLPTAGEVRRQGQPVRFAGVRDAMASGVAMIHQELDVIDDLTASENIFLGSELASLGLLKSKEMNEQADALLQRVGAGFPSSTPVGRLSVAGKQLVEIAKALSHNADVLILDEPTAVLSDRETEALFRLIRELKAEGKTLIYISHRLAEVQELCDRVTVLRDGELIETLDDKPFTPERMADLMVGRTLGDHYPPAGRHELGPVVLELKDVSSPPVVQSASLSLRAGEIVGLAGLIGSGRTELAEALVGLRPLGGQMTLSGSPARFRSPRQAMEQGLVYISEDRKDAGLVLAMSVTENITLANLAAHSHPLISRGQESACAEEWQKKLDIRAGSLAAPVGSLSGGNQQKAAIAKWLDGGPKVVILDEPTRGVDVGAKREIYTLIHRLAEEEGMACLVISSELSEILGVCSRTLVMRDGRIVGELAGDDMTEEAMMRLAAGVEGGEAA